MKKLAFSCAVVFVLFALASLTSAQQVVYLDFDSATSGADHVYTTTERNSIQSLMAGHFAPFNYVFVQTAPVSGDYSTLAFNDGPAFGLADAIDFRNLNQNDNATIDVNSGATTSAEFITLSANVASHELGHLVGLRHGDSFGPIGSGIDPNTVSASSYFPSYNGPLGADETSMHLMESDSIFIEHTVNQFFSERSATKLTFNESGSVLAESVGSKDTLLTAQTISLGSLLVPNTLNSGDGAATGDFDVDAVAVTGSLGVGGEIDLYEFEGFAGDLFNFEVISEALDRLADTIDPQLTVLDSTGTPVEYFGSTAFNDDEFETFDSIIIDLVLPSDGTFYAQVNAYDSVDIGDYELFMYRFNGSVPEPSSAIVLVAMTLGLVGSKRRKKVTPC